MIFFLIFFFLLFISIFFKIFSFSINNPEIIFIIVVIISSIKIVLVGIMKRSFAELDKSLSCHKEMFSKAMLTLDFNILAKEDILSLFIGFFFTGTALLPI